LATAVGPCFLQRLVSALQHALLTGRNFGKLVIRLTEWACSESDMFAKVLRMFDP